jgi:hypothetical protein
MENNVFHISEPLDPDVIIQHRVSKETLHDVFCFNLNKSAPNPKHIPNNNISLYTFLANDYKKLFVDISKLKTSAIDQQISADFLTHVSKLKYSSENYKTHIQNHEDIQTYIDVSCKEKAQEDMKWVKSNSKITPSKNTKHNITCGKLLTAMIDQVPGRFDTGDKLTPLPFRKNDKIVYYCTITAGGIQRIYGIHMCVV